MAAFTAQSQKAKPLPPLVIKDAYQLATETARAEQQKGNLPAAYKALQQYMVPRDLRTLPAELIWYAAQLAYLNHETEAATKYYERASALLPGDAVFMGDYGSFLMNQRHYGKAITVLKPHQESVLNRYYLANTYYWQGDYQKAKSITKTFSAQERQLDYVQQIIHELDMARRARLEVDLAYHTDDQPLQYTAENIRVSKRLSNLLEPMVGVSLSQFQSDSGSSGTAVLRFSNRFHINPIKTDITVGLGNLSVQQSSELLYEARIHTQLSKTFSLDAHLSKEPYVYTIASSRSLVTYDDKSLALNVDSRRLQGRIQYSNNSFGGNNINNTSLWLLTPMLNKKAIKIKLGYAYQRSDADSSKYVPKTNSSGLENNIVGIYNPYFTPVNQQIHSALIQLLVSPTSRFTASVTASLPLSAKIDNPYLYTLYDAGGNVVVKRDFLRTDYYPAELKISAGYKISDFVNINAGYQYANLFFYKGHFLNLSTGILF